MIYFFDAIAKLYNNNLDSEVKNAREANEIYDAIKERGSTQILGHLTF
jgi:hypothetical protein